MFWFLKTKTLAERHEKLMADLATGILVSIALAASTYTLTGDTLTMNGGTSAAPTGAGITAKDALIAAGWTVATN